MKRASDTVSITDAKRVAKLAGLAAQYYAEFRTALQNAYWKYDDLQTEKLLHFHHTRDLAPLDQTRFEMLRDALARVQGTWKQGSPAFKSEFCWHLGEKYRPGKGALEKGLQRWIAICQERSDTYKGEKGQDKRNLEPLRAVYECLELFWTTNQVGGAWKPTFPENVKTGSRKPSNSAGLLFFHSALYCAKRTDPKKRLPHPTVMSCYSVRRHFAKGRVSKAVKGQD